MEVYHTYADPLDDFKILSTLIREVSFSDREHQMACTDKICVLSREGVLSERVSFKIRGIST